MSPWISTVCFVCAHIKDQVKVERQKNAQMVWFRVKKSIKKTKQPPLRIATEAVVVWVGIDLLSRDI